MARAELVKSFRFEAAHRLPHAAAEDPEVRIHGHSFRVEVFVAGEIDPALGWVVDFADIKAAFAPIFSALDHRYLNEISGLENPTADCIAAWIGTRMRAALPGLTRIIVYEAERTGCFVNTGAASAT